MANATTTSDNICVQCPAGTSDVTGNPLTPCVPCSGLGLYVPPGSAGPCPNFQCNPGWKIAESCSNVAY